MEYNVLRLTIILTILRIRKALCFDDEFGTCIKTDAPSNLKSCFGQQLIKTLNNFEATSDYEISEGIVFERDDTVMSRSTPNFLQQDPLDFRGILENAGVIMGQRSLKVDMKKIYPGLYMRIGPTIGGSAAQLGVVEFAMDPNRNDRIYQPENESTARIMTRQFVVPFLLGVKFNLSLVLPIIIGLIALLHKKALFLLKVLFLLSTFFGYGGLNNGYGAIPFGGTGAFPYKYPAHYDTHQNYYEDNLYKGTEQFGIVAEPLPVVDNFYEFDKKQQSKDKDSKPFTRAGRSLVTNGYRTFSWQSKQV